ncbi:MAG: hypothetical protein PHP86_19780 [Nevskiales bacterium]|nr:hypothetical protein [Nevskiales bacterium]
MTRILTLPAFGRAIPELLEVISDLVTVQSTFARVLSETPGDDDDFDTLVRIHALVSSAITALLRWAGKSRASADWAIEHAEELGMAQDQVAEARAMTPPSDLAFAIGLCNHHLECLVLRVVKLHERALELRHDADA